MVSQLKFSEESAWAGIYSLFLRFAKGADLLGCELRERAKASGCQLAPEHEMCVFDREAYFFVEGGEDMLLEHVNDYK